MVSLLLATNNPDKIREIQAILDGLHIELRLLAPADIGLHIDVIEDGKTYAENAAKKATAFSRAAMMPALADDSGLEVAALNGAPGINSHRYAPNFNATDADRRKYLLQNLEGKTRPWLARFYCVVAIAAPHLKKIEYGVGEVRGLIIPDERGTGGFGYDPIFFIPEQAKTMAQLDMEEKNSISHRARAIRSAVEIIEAL
jgi:XTP/dITP diphosphohydrolase